MASIFNTKIALIKLISRLKQARGSFAGEGRVSAIGDARRFQGYE